MTYWLGTDGQARDMLFRDPLRPAHQPDRRARSRCPRPCHRRDARPGRRLFRRPHRSAADAPRRPAAVVSVHPGGPGPGFRCSAKAWTRSCYALVIVALGVFRAHRARRGDRRAQREYVEAARCMSLSWQRILWRHMLPNCLPPLIVIATIDLARAIALEATLSFLGLGVPITEPSLGLLISNGFEYMLSGKYWIASFRASRCAGDGGDQSGRRSFARHSQSAQRNLDGVRLQTRAPSSIQSMAA